MHTTRLDLESHCWEVGDQLQGNWIFSTDLFDKPTIERMAGHFQTLLQAIVDNPAQSIAELPLLTEAERHQLLFEWNDTAADTPRDKCIHELFEEQVARTPDAVALVFEDQQLTYAELNARADQLAYHLQTLGVGPDVLVGICVERSLDMVVGLLGILKAGGAYLPSTLTYPTRTPGFHARRCGPTSRRHTIDLSRPVPGDTAARLAGQLATISRRRNLCAALHRDTTAHNLAYCIYTSGSTGRPKGTLLRTSAACATWPRRKLRRLACCRKTACCRSHP